MKQARKIVIEGKNLDQYFRPGRMFMENLRSRKSTELTWRNYRFGLGFGADRDFSMNSLRRVR